MKTGGTMNFLKRAGAILMLVAVFASSCNKYADDFKQINTKLDLLATAVAGVSTLSTDMTTLKGKVDGLVTSVAGLPTTASITALAASLKTVSDNVLAIQTKLQAVADSGKATAAIVRDLKTNLASLAKTVADNNTAMNTKLVALGTTDTAQSAQLKALVDANVTILANIATLQTSLDGIALTGSATDTATALTIQGLQLLLNAQKLQLDQILLNTSMYNGDVTVTTDAEVTFFMAKLAQLGIVNGNVKIDKTNISTAQLANVAIITNKITAVIGTGNVTVDLIKGDAIDLSKLVSVKGAMTVTGTAKASGADIDLSSLDNVGGTLTLNYDGSYASASLKKVGGDLLLVNKAVVTATTPNGTTSINLPNVVVSGKVDDVVIATATGVVVFPLASDVILAGGVSSLTADVAINIKLGSTDYSTTLGVSSSLTAAATIDLSAATNITGAAIVTGFGATAVNLAGLVTAPAGITITTGSTGTVDLTKFNEPVGVLTTAGPKILLLPAMAKGTIVSNAETVTLTAHDWAITPALSAVKYLTCGAVANTVSLPATVITADITGKTVTTVPQPATLGGVTATSANTVLTTVKLGTNVGTLGVVSLSGCAALTSVTTGGVLNSFTLNACNALKSADLVMAHTHYIGGLGSTLAITSNTNTAFTSVVTSVDYPKYITITGNTSLSSLNLASYQTKLLSATGAITTIAISGNKLSGSYTNAIAITPTTAYVETTITSADLKTLRAFVVSHTVGDLPTLVMAIDLDAVKIGTGTATLLSVKMLADTDAKAAYVVAPAGTMGVNDSAVWPDSKAGIDQIVEMKHVVQ